MNAFHVKKYVWIPFPFLCPRSGYRFGVIRYLAEVLLNATFFASIITFLLYSEFGHSSISHLGFTYMWLYALFGGYYLFVSYCWNKEHIGAHT